VHFVPPELTYSLAASIEFIFQMPRLNPALTNIFLLHLIQQMDQLLMLLQLQQVILELFQKNQSNLEMFLCPYISIIFEQLVV
jgi:hypothetical protein